MSIQLKISDENISSHNCNYQRDGDNWIMTLETVPEAFEFHFGPGPDGKSNEALDELVKQAQELNMGY